MQLLKKSGVIVLFSFLLACGNSEPPASAQVSAENNAGTAGQTKKSHKPAASPHSIQGMKKVMDDARGVETLLQQGHDKRMQEMNK